VSAADLHRTIEAGWRIESARVIAGLTRDVGLTEDLAQEALLAAKARPLFLPSSLFGQAATTTVRR
jgi:hypothetical protein